MGDERMVIAVMRQRVRRPCSATPAASRINVAQCSSVPPRRKSVAGRSGGTAVVGRRGGRTYMALSAPIRAPISAGSSLASTSSTTGISRLT